MDALTYTLGGLSVAAVITGLINVFKVAGMPSKYAPMVSVALGAIIGIAGTLAYGGTMLIGVMTGITAGLVSCGFYDLTKYKSSTDTTTTEITEETVVNSKRK